MAAAFGTVACAELGADPTLSAILGRANTEETVAAGLREALRVGGERSIARASRPGGFWNDARIRIPVPPKVENVAKAMRAMGFGATVDDLELSMNRAAERASGEALTLITEAVASMTIDDAFAILNGPDDAATQYFRRRSEDGLRARFSPVIETAMRSSGVYRAYEQLLTRNRVLALLPDPSVELNRYVTDETLDGLFTIIREEEGRIRHDPVARTTDLLRRVFGS